jgi:hypothetical protein
VIKRCRKSQTLGCASVDPRRASREHQLVRNAARVCRQCAADHLAVKLGMLREDVLVNLDL